MTTEEWACPCGIPTCTAYRPKNMETRVESGTYTLHTRQPDGSITDTTYNYDGTEVTA
jgi:hypothetical protein